MTHLQMNWKALLYGTPPPVHPQEIYRIPASGEEVLLVPPQQDHDVVQEEAPRHIRDEDQNDQ